MARVVADAANVAREVASTEGLRLEISYDDIFVACRNDPGASGVVRRALDALGVKHGPFMLPLRGSEDLGGFGAKAGLALENRLRRRPPSAPTAGLVIAPNAC